MNVSFLNPWFLLGLPAISIPVIIHLLSKKKTISQPFSYIKFIQLASLKVVKRHKLKQLILLLLRTLLLLLIVFLFARPLIHMAPIFARGMDTSLSTVIVLDSSYSMGYRDQQLSRFEMGKEAAVKILKLMEIHDRTALLLASDRIESGVKYLTSDMDVLIDEIENSSISSRPSNLLPAMSEAYSLLKGSLSPNKQIIMVTDMAANSWAEINKEAITRFDSKIKLIVIDLGKEDSSNAAVKGIDKGVMTRGQMLKLKAGVINYSDAQLNNLLVSLVIGRDTGEIVRGRKADQGFLKLPKRDSREKDFFYNFSEEGAYLGQVKIKEDGLSIDDNYYFKVSVQEKIKVLCIDGDPGFSSFEKETFYLRLALDPYDKGASVVPTIITGNELKEHSLKGYRVIVSANVGEFEDDEIRNIYDFVKKGGGLMFFLGENVDADYYNDALGDLLPAKLLDVNYQEAGWVIGYSDTSHPVLEVFTGEKQGDLSLAVFNKWFVVLPHENSNVLMRIAQNPSMKKEHEGDPLLLERKLPYPRSGRVMLFTSTVDREWNNFPAKPLFLPMLQQLMSYLTEKSSGEGYRDSLTLGESLIIPIKKTEMPGTVTLRLPSGRKEKISPVRSKEFNGIEYSKAVRPGIYTFEWKSAGQRVIKHVVYNLDLESGESDLTKTSVKEIRKRLTDTPVIIIDNLTDLEKILLSILHGKEASTVLVLLIFLFLILEGYVANRRRNE